MSLVHIGPKAMLHKRCTICYFGLFQFKIMRLQAVLKGSVVVNRSSQNGPACFITFVCLVAPLKALVWMSLRPGIGQSPGLALYEFGPKWELLSFQMHRIEGLNYSHDFLLLPDYYILHMTPFVEISKLG